PGRPDDDALSRRSARLAPIRRPAVIFAQTSHPSISKPVNMIRLVLSVSALLIFHLAACHPAGNTDTNEASDQIPKTTVQEEDVPQISPVARVVGPAEFQKLLEADKDALLLDVRTPGEFQQGHLANAKLLDFNDPSFEDKLTALDKTKRYHVYCAVGG